MAVATATMQIAGTLMKSAGSMHAESGAVGGEGHALAMASRQVEAEMLQQLGEIPAPSDRDGGAGHHVFDGSDSIRRTRRPLPQRRVAVRVGAAGHGHHRGKLGVAQPGKHTADPGDHEGDYDGGAGVRGRGQAG